CWFAANRSPPDAGVRILARQPDSRFSIPHVLFHHAHWDGSGYPCGRRGDEIPLEARVLAVADAFDAMISPRPYRPALPASEALAEIDRCAGTQFDPVVAGLFVELCRAEAPRLLVADGYEGLTKYSLCRRAALLATGSALVSPSRPYLRRWALPASSPGSEPRHPATTR